MFLSLPIPWCLCGLQQDCSRNLGVNHPWHHPLSPVYTPISNWAPGPLISNFPNRSNICHLVTSFSVTGNTNLSHCFHSFPRSRLLLCLKRPVAPHCTYNKGPNAHHRVTSSYLRAPATRAFLLRVPHRHSASTHHRAFSEVDPPKSNLPLPCHSPT